jgi:hypothetical protein
VKASAHSSGATGAGGIDDGPQGIYCSIDRSAIDPTLDELK